jgi:hypothetical protein
MFSYIDTIQNLPVAQKRSLVKSIKEMIKEDIASNRAANFERKQNPAALRAAKKDDPNSNLEQKLGFSAKESATLVSNARLQGENTEEVLESNIKIVGEFNKQNRTALNVNKVLKEAVNASMAMQANLGFSNDKLISAASSATKLGLSLSEVEGVADSLLNFEDSITKELEAELLTGKDLNFEKERQLALAGDLEGLSKSLNDNAAIQDAFASKNVLAQNALAESMGMTRDQLAKITLQQKFNNMAAEDFKNFQIYLCPPFSVDIQIDGTDEGKKSDKKSMIQQQKPRGNKLPSA